MKPTDTLLGRIASVLAAVVLAGCATTPPAPVRFELVDPQAQVHVGSLDSQTRGMTVAIGTEVFNGFYVLEIQEVSTTLYPTGGWYRRPMMPMDSHGVSVSNRAKAHLRSAEGGHISCDFLLEGSRAAGNCKNTSGANFQFVAGQ